MIEFITLLANLIVGGLLVAVIIYCKRLNHNIRVLRDSRGELAQMFKEFDASIERAAASVDELQNSARKTDALLKDKLAKANMIADDLSFMIERGNKMADQLESGLKGGRQVLREKEQPSATAPTPPSGAKTSPDHLSMLAAKSSATPAAPSTASRDSASSTPPRKQTASSIEAVLEQMANRNNPAPHAGEAGRKPNTRIRSKAEQELFDSLKSGR